MVSSNLTKAGLLFLGISFLLGSCTKIAEVPKTSTNNALEYITNDYNVKSDDTLDAVTTYLDGISNDPSEFSSFKLSDLRSEAYETIRNHFTDNHLNNDKLIMQDNAVYIQYNSELQYLYLSIPKDNSINLSLNKILFGISVFDNQGVNVNYEADKANKLDETWTFTGNKENSEIILKLKPLVYYQDIYNPERFSEEKSKYGYPNHLDKYTFHSESYPVYDNLTKEIIKNISEENKTNPLLLISELTRILNKENSDYLASKNYTDNQLAVSVARAYGIPTVEIDGIDINNNEDWIASYIEPYGWICSNPKNDIDVEQFKFKEYFPLISQAPLPEGTLVNTIRIEDIYNGLNNAFSKIKAVHDIEDNKNSN